MSFSEPSEHAGTKQKILDAAINAFAQKGYREVTIAEICGLAGVNIALVNYYFGSKKNLYVEAWRKAFDRGIEKHPPEERASGDQNPEQRLKTRIASLMRRIFDNDTREFEIVRHELACPTGELWEAHEKTIGPFRRETFKVVREILGPAATMDQAVLALFTVISPVLHMIHRVKRDNNSNDPRIPPPGLLEVRDPEMMIEHTLRFVMAGLEEMKKGIEAGNWPHMELSDDFIEKFRFDG